VALLMHLKYLGGKRNNVNRTDVMKPGQTHR